MLRGEPSEKETADGRSTTHHREPQSIGDGKLEQTRPRETSGKKSLARQKQLLVDTVISTAAAEKTFLVGLVWLRDTITVEV